MLRISRYQKFLLQKSLDNSMLLGEKIIFDIKVRFTWKRRRGACRSSR